MDTSGGFIGIEELIAEWSADPAFAAEMEAARKRRAARKAGVEEIQGAADL